MSRAFIEKAMKVHGDKYDYSRVDYKTNRTKIKIICKTHGEFLKRADNHLSGQGCPKCKNKKLDTIMFVERSIKIHNDKYDYSLVEYSHSHKKINIICKDHGIFSHTANSHLKGHGCPMCGFNGYSKMALEWLSSLNIPNLRTALSPEGEFTIPGSMYKADGYCEETNTIYEFHGDYWHGNPKKYDPNEINKSVGKTFGELYENTLRKKEYILSLGFNYIEKWESCQAERHDL